MEKKKCICIREINIVKSGFDGRFIKGMVYEYKTLSRKYIEVGTGMQGVETKFHVIFDNIETIIDPFSFNRYFSDLINHRETQINKIV